MLIKAGLRFLDLKPDLAPVLEGYL